MKSKKGSKIQYRLRKPHKATLEKLYKYVPETCIGCCYGCIGCFDGVECKNRKIEYSLIELVEMLKEERVNIPKFIEKYNNKHKSGKQLDLDKLINYLKGKEIMSWLYYDAIVKRLHLSSCNPLESGYDPLEHEFLQSPLVKEGSNG